jgi:hypothetical protein
MVSSVWHWGPARVAAAVATAVQDEVTATAAVCRTAVAVAAESSATAEAAGASTAATETMGQTATLSTEKVKECRSNGRQVHPCHLSYFPLSVLLPVLFFSRGYVWLITYYNSED